MTWLDECLQAAYARGVARCEYSIRQGHRHRGWQSPPNVARHNAGMSAASEWWVAHLTGGEWLAGDLSPDDGIDVRMPFGQELSVRWRSYDGPNLYCTFRPSDGAAEWTVLVVGRTFARFRLVGHILTADAMRERFFYPKGSNVWGKPTRADGFHIHARHFRAGFPNR